MKKTIGLLAIIALVATSCSRSVTVQQAANKNFKSCRPLR